MGARIDCGWLHRGMLGLALLWLVGCGPQETVLVPVHRFVDDFATPPASDAIRRDGRSVLRTWRSHRIYQGTLDAPPEGRRTIVVGMSPTFRGAKSLVVEPFVKPAGAEERFRRQPASVRRVLQRLSTQQVDVELDFEGLDALDFYVMALVPPLLPIEPIQTRGVSIPAGAVLGFALGIHEAAWHQGPVRFAIEACSGDACQPVFEESFDPVREDSNLWPRRRVDLSAFAGEERSFRFTSRRERKGPGFSLPLWANPTLYAPAPRPAGDLNVVLISLDTLRADHLPAYGYPRDTAPFFSELAAAGTVFENAISASSTTGPSHMTMFTGLQPGVHDVRGFVQHSALPASIPTLAERLRAVGFETGAVTEGGGVPRGHGFERGFDVFVENLTPVPHAPGRESAVTFPRGLRWVERMRDRRFFLFLHTYEVHAPYVPSAAYDGLFEGEPGGAGASDHPEARSRALLYDREIRAVDDQLRTLVAGLRASGALDRTLLIITSDHGEEFLDHGHFGHGAKTFEEIVHVPLLLVGPGIPAGRRVAAPVALLDLMPTVLELAGVPPPEGIMGRSFAALARGGTPDASWSERPIYSEARFPRGLGPDGFEPLPTPVFSLRQGHRKVIRVPQREGARYSWFDLAADPLERRDLRPRRGAEVADLEALLDRYGPSTDALRDGYRNGDRAESALDDRDREEQLRALGYIE